MKRIDFADGIGAVEDKHGAGKDGWTNGDPADLSSGTVPQDYWFDGVQEELMAIIEADGDTPDGGDFAQVLSKLLLRSAASPDANRTMLAPLIFSLGTDPADHEVARIDNTTGPTTGDYLLFARIGNQRIYIGPSDVVIASLATYNNTTGAWSRTTGAPYSLTRFGISTGAIDRNFDGGGWYPISTTGVECFGVVQSSGSPSVLYNGRGLVDPPTTTATYMDIGLSTTYDSTSEMMITATCSQNLYNVAVTAQSTSSIRIAAYRIDTDQTFPMNSSTANFHVYVRGKVS